LKRPAWKTSFVLRYLCPFAGIVGTALALAAELHCRKLRRDAQPVSPWPQMIWLNSTQIAVQISINGSNYWFRMEK